jgi:hypothetical protein
LEGGTAVLRKRIGHAGCEDIGQQGAGSKRNSMRCGPQWPYFAARGRCREVRSPRRSDSNRRLLVVIFDRGCARSDSKHDHCASENNDDVK